MPRIRDIAAVCKSKNAGPFELTIDVVFDDPALFDKVKRTRVLGPDLFARLYGVRAEDVLFTVYDRGTRLQGDPAASGAGRRYRRHRRLRRAAARPPARCRHSDLSGLSPPCFDGPNRANTQSHTRNRLTQSR